MNVRPLGDRILVTPEKPPEKTDGGIILTPQSQGQDYQIATVSIVGDLVTKVKKGDKILYMNTNFWCLPPYAGGYTLMREEDVVVVLE